MTQLTIVPQCRIQDKRTGIMIKSETLATIVRLTRTSTKRMQIRLGFGMTRGTRKETYATWTTTRTTSLTSSTTVLRHQTRPPFVSTSRMTRTTMELGTSATTVQTSPILAKKTQTM